MAARLNRVVECVAGARNTTGESPVWSARENALCWVDIPGVASTAGGPRPAKQRVWMLPAAVGSIGMRERGGELPITHPTMPCYGGPGLRTLYVTSLRENLTESELAKTPQAGGVFMFEPGVAGAPVAHYKG